MGATRAGRVGRGTATGHGRFALCDIFLFLPNVRRWAKLVLWVLAGLGVLFLGLVGAAIWWRLPLATWVLRNSLADAGAAPRDLRVTDLGLHHATISPLELVWAGQQVRAEAIIVDRPDLFSRSLGRVEARGVSVTLNLAGLSHQTAASDRAAPKSPATTEGSPQAVSIDDLSVVGQLAVNPAGATQLLAFEVQVVPDGSGRIWHAKASAHGAGVDATAEGAYDLANRSWAFEVPDCRVNLGDAAGFLDRVLPSSLAGWEFGGTLTLSANGHLADGRLTGGCAVQLRDGTVRDADRKVALEGIEGGISTADFEHFATPAAQAFRVKSGRIGDVELAELNLRYQVRTLHQVWVESGAAELWGGKVAVEPFGFDPSVVDYAVTLECDGLQMEKLMSLFPTATAKVSGLADGRVPVHYGSQGFRFSHGWLTLKPGKTGTLQIDQPGLLTGNLKPRDLAYGTMKAVETGLLHLRVDTLRAEIYPPDAPAGRSVQITIAGQPLDPRVNAPVTFELNINGPIEKLIQWGLDSRMKFSTK